MVFDLFLALAKNLTRRSRPSEMKGSKNKKDKQNLDCFDPRKSKIRR